MPRHSAPFLLSLALVAVLALPAQAVEVQSGISMIAVAGAAPGTEIVLEDRRGGERRGSTDRFGSLLFRELVGGEIYTVRAGDGSPPVETRVRRFADLHAPHLYRKQVLKPGYQYIETRDGTLLAATVRLPPGPGPFPTVVEYSGYSVADPDQTQPVSLLAGALG